MNNSQDGLSNNESEGILVNTEVERKESDSDFTHEEKKSDQLPNMNTDSNSVNEKAEKNIEILPIIEGSFKTADSVFEFYEKRNFELVTFKPNSGIMDHGMVAWRDPSLPKWPDYHCYDVVLRNTYLADCPNSILLPYVICKFTNDTFVCVLTIGKHYYHKFRILVKELDKDKAPTQKEPYFVDNTQLINDIRLFESINPEKYPFLKEELKRFLTVLDEQRTSKTKSKVKNTQVTTDNREVIGKRQQPSRTAKHSMLSGIKQVTHKILPPQVKNRGKKTLANKVKPKNQKSNYSDEDALSEKV